MRPAWLEVDLAAIRHNMQLLQQHIGPHCRLMPVIKADAYGMGDIPVAEACLQGGARAFAVATLDEALRLRDGGISVPILILSRLADEDIPTALQHDIMLNACELPFAAAISRAAEALGLTARVHLKVDTGMSRLGLSPDEAGAAEAAAIYALPHLEIVGIFSHFATADEPDNDFAAVQLASFRRFCGLLQARGLTVPPRHMSASAACTELKEAHDFEIARPGIIIYGVYPDEIIKGSLPVQEALQIKAKIIQTHDLAIGQPASYGSIWRAERPSRLATLGLGYADGYPRLLSNRAEVLVCGRRAPIRGRICMDHLMIDITDIPEAQVGTEVTLLGHDGAECIDVYELSRLSSSIPHELMSRLSPRLARVYKNRI